jgi:hypothetical protein
MIYTDMTKPSANMNMSPSDLARMLQEQHEEEYKHEQDRIQSEQNLVNKAMEEAERSHMERIQNRNALLEQRAARNEKVKSAFLAECMMKLFRESFQGPMTKSDENVAKNLINQFITENGAGKLINDFGFKNLTLSEMSRVCMRAYSAYLETSQAPETSGIPSREEDYMDYKLDDTVADDFYKDLDGLDVSDAGKLIKERVSDAISEFIDSNVTNKLEYQDIIQAAQDRVRSISGSDEDLAEAYISQAKRKINDYKLASRKNVYHCLVESLAKTIYKDEQLKAKYIHEATMDMDAVTNSATIIYTMLEMMNTTKMIEMDEEFINEYIKSLNE